MYVSKDLMWWRENEKTWNLNKALVKMSATRLNNKGDRGSPRIEPLPGLKKQLFLSLILTHIEPPSTSCLIQFTQIVGLVWFKPWSKFVCCLWCVWLMSSDVACTRQVRIAPGKENRAPGLSARPSVLPDVYFWLVYLFTAGESHAKLVSFCVCHFFFIVGVRLSLSAWWL